MKHKRLRRPLLASLALLAFAGPAMVSGCGAGFAPISKVSGLRVLAVVADKPYAQPGDTVTFTMTYADPPGVTETPEILWIGGCNDPAGDEYYLCYEQVLKNPIIGSGATFSVQVPADIVSRRPPSAPEGSVFVFFGACVGGSIMPLPGLLDGGSGGAAAAGSGLAGNFPFGCFDAQGQQLPAGNFVPGYTEIFVFRDGRTNENPVVNGLSINQADTDAGVPDGGTVGACSVPEGSRLGPTGCGNPNPVKDCEAQKALYQVTVDVPPDVAEIDPSGMSQSGAPLYESVWVDYFADQGDIDTPTQLISDSDGKLQPSFGTNWLAPPAPEAGSLPVNIWAVVHDSRGGETVKHEVLHVP